MSDAVSSLRTLADARRRMGLTLRQLAAQSGVSLSSLVAFERGANSRPRARTITLLLEALDIDQSTFDQLQHTSQLDAEQRRSINASIVRMPPDDEEAEPVEPLCRTVVRLRRTTQPTAAEYAEREGRARVEPLTAREIERRLPATSDPVIGVRLVLQRHAVAQRGHRRRRTAPQGITQAELAARVGMSVEAYRRIEHGQVLPRDHTVAALARELDIEVTQLVHHCHRHHRYHHDLGHPSCASSARPRR